MTCEGCKEEMYECYKWQQKGYDAGLEESLSGEHLFVFVLDKKGELIVY